MRGILGAGEGDLRSRSIHRAGVILHGCVFIRLVMIILDRGMFQIHTRPSRSNDTGDV